MKENRESRLSRIADRSLRENAQVFSQLVNQTNFKKFTIIATVVLLCVAIAGTLAIKFTQHPMPKLSELTNATIAVGERPRQYWWTLSTDADSVADSISVQADVDAASFVAVVQFNGQREFCYGGTRDRVVVEQVLRGDTSMVGQTVYFYERAFIDYSNGEWNAITYTTSLFREGEHYLIWADQLDPLDPIYWQNSGREELPEFSPVSIEISGFNLADTTSTVCLPDGQEKRDLTQDTNEFNCVTQEEIDNLYHIKEVILEQFDLR